MIAMLMGWLASPLGKVVAGVVVAGGLLTFTHWKAYEAGRAVAQAAFSAQVNEDNDHAGKMAEDWRSRLRACVDAGGLFDFADGTCDD